MKGKMNSNSIFLIGSLLLLASLLLCFATLTVIAALNVAALPITKQWQTTFSNIGYGIIAGSVLMFMVSIYNLLKGMLSREEAG